MREDKKRATNIRFLTGIAISAVLTASIIVTQPLHITNVYAIVYEDCDLDGYDDATGKALPWVGFDGTKGDSIPAGWDGTTYDSKGDYEASLNKNSDSNSSGNSSDSDSNKSSSSSSTNSNTSSGSSSTKSNQSSSSNNKSQSSSSGTKSSSSGSNSRSSSKKSTSAGSSSSSSGDSQSTENETVNTGTEEETTTVAKSKKKTKKKKSAENVIETTTAAESETVDGKDVVNTVGILDINEVDGSVIHAGSDIIIKGTGFAVNVNDIIIEIHSDNKINLANVNTAEDGSFEVQAYLPEDIGEGTHEIVLLYQGQEIINQSIEVGPKVADTFLKAATVGFTTDNKGLIPGLLILAALAVGGVVTLIGGKIWGRKA